jgi:hypothetical protein
MEVTSRTDTFSENTVQSLKMGRNFLYEAGSQLVRPSSEKAGTSLEMEVL